MIRLIYLNAQNVYINKKILNLKTIRGGGLKENLVLIAIGVVVY